MIKYVFQFQHLLYENISSSSIAAMIISTFLKTWMLASMLALIWVRYSFCNPRFRTGHGRKGLNMYRCNACHIILSTYYILIFFIDLRVNYCILGPHLYLEVKFTKQLFGFKAILIRTN